MTAPWKDDNMYLVNHPRDLAVLLVDSMHGYTCEFSGTPQQHISEYDHFENIIREVLGLHETV